MNVEILKIIIILPIQTLEPSSSISDSSRHANSVNAQPGLELDAPLAPLPDTLDHPITEAIFKVG